ncbi:hypothetical protein B0H16DRAFT_1745585 [Mycena metata]|uniref:Uncharacterized protein n=1 Tax=Mycena metata TaxID=1033252 RepID=A0AAD7MC29_9AGAR|nr:hypothetical protein B0H16DRAFT_1745585 [Mycena metata]
MNAETYSADENVPAPAPDEYDFTSESPGGGMFAGSHHFTLAGGTFNNNTNNYATAPTVPPGLYSVHESGKYFLLFRFSHDSNR